MSTFHPRAFKAVTDEEILDSILQSASAEMTPLHINQPLFIFIEPSAAQRLKAKAPLMNTRSRVFALHSL